MAQLWGSGLKETEPKAPQKLIVPGLSKAGAPAPEDKLVFDDISRLLKGEEPRHIPLSKDVKSKGNGEVTRLQDALGLGKQTRAEVGRDWEVLKEEALRAKQELREEIRKQERLGTPGSKAKAKKLREKLDLLNEALKAGEAGAKEPVSSSTKDARIAARYFDRDFTPERTVTGKATDYAWEVNARTGANGKKGGFGSVLFEGDNVVKRGDIGERELEVMRKAGEAGIGPQLIYGEIGKRKETFGSVDIHEGRVAMTRVPGIEIGEFPSSKERVGDTTVGNVFWSARAALHRLGIAHNDCHGQNIIIDDRGFPRFVDFGLSQDNPKAALSEAFGGIVNRTVIPPGAVIQGGIRTDIQAGKVRISGVGAPAADRPESLNRIYANLTNVKTHLRKLGMSNDEIAQVMASGIRNPESFYNKGAWGKLTNEEALNIIGMLYNGV